MVAFPGLSAERLPSWSTETTPGSEEAQETDLSVASSGEMVAIKVSVPPVTMLSSWRSREMPATGISGSATVTAQESERPLAAVAVMVAFPGLSAERLPSWSTETTPGSEEAQETDLSVASSGEMVAIKVSVPPVTMLSSWRSREMPATGISGSATVTAQESERPLAAVAVMVAFPGFRAERLPSWSTETTPGSEEAQETDLSVALSGEMVATRVSVPPVSILSSWRSREMPATGISITVISPLDTFTEEESSSLDSLRYTSTLGVIEVVWAPSLISKVAVKRCPKE